MEDIIPILIFLLIIFGSGIKKLIRYLAEQSQSSGEQGRSTGTSGTSRRQTGGTTTQRTRETSGRQEGPIRLGGKVSRTQTAEREQQSRQRTSRQQASSQTTKRTRRSRGQRRQRSVQAQGQREMSAAQKRAQKREEEARKKAEEARKEAEKAKEKISAGVSGPEAPEEPGEGWGERLEAELDRRLGSSELKQGIIWKEILGPPVSRRKGPGGRIPRRRE